MKPSKDDKEAIIKIIRDYFANTEVKKVYLFGSFARDESLPLSDIDLLMELEKPIGYLRIIEHKQELEKILFRKIDLLTSGAISPKIYPHIKKDLKLIYEKSGQSPN